MAACLLLLWHLQAEDTPRETVEDRTTEKVATVLIFLLAMHVSVHWDSVRDMILHYTNGENIRAIYGTDKMADPQL